MDTTDVGLQNTCNSQQQSGQSIAIRLRRAIRYLVNAALAGLFAFLLATAVLFLINTCIDLVRSHQAVSQPATKSHASLTDQIASACAMSSDANPFAAPVSGCIDLVMKLVVALSGSDMPHSVFKQTSEHARRVMVSIASRVANAAGSIVLGQLPGPFNSALRM